MNFSRTYAIFLRQLFLFRSTPTRLASVFVWMIIDITQWGFISKYLGTMGRATFGFLTCILGAIILWGFIARIQQGIMTSFLEDIWSQNFINFFASPLKIIEYLSGLVLTSVATAVTGFAVVVSIAGIAFGYNFFQIGLALFPFMGILFVFGTAMGIFVCGMIFRLGPTAEWLGWPIPLVLSLFSGVYFPVATLPKAFQVVSRLIPASYVFEDLRAVLTGRASFTDLTFYFAIGGTLALLYLALAYAFFIKIYRRNLESGSIARFSAES